MKKLIIALVLSFSLISSNFLYATEINNSLVPTENIDNTNEVEVPVSAGNTTTTGSTNVLNNYSDTNVPYETNPVTNSLESVIPDEDLYDINEENFPDIALRTFLKSYDIPAEGESEGNKKLSREEIKKIDYISLFYDTNDATDVNLKGLELLPYINNLYISNRTSEKKIVHNIDSLNNLENLNTLNLSGVNVDDSIKKLNISTISSLSLTNTKNDVEDFINLSSLNTISLNEQEVKNLNFINLYPKLETAYISNPSNLLSIDINKINHTLKSLSVSGSKLSNINGLEKYQALETLSISNGYISNFKEIVDSVPANLKYLSIIDQEVKSNNTFEPNIPYTLNDVILPETSNSQISITTPNGSYIDNNLIFKDMAISLYHLRYECEKDGRNYNFSVKVNNVKPKGYNPSQWIKTFGSSFTESFLRDKTEFKVTLNANVTDVAVDSLFANKFTVNNKDYTYSYALGSNNSSKVYATYGNPNSRTYNISLRGNHITSYIKTENKKSYLKTVTEFIIDDLVFEKEEIAYVEDDGIRHDVKYTNKSGKKVEGIEFHQMLDTMLNENDSIPIYADGKGNAYIVSPDFTLFLELVNNDGELIVAPYGVGPKSTDGKAAKEYKRGDTLLIDTDTAVYYGLGKKDFDIDQSYSYSFKETIYTEIPEIKTVDKKIKVSSSWDPMDHLIGVYNEKGEDLDRSKLEIVHNTDPNVAGEYEITFIYNKVYSKKAKLTVLEEAVPPADEEKEPKADDNPKVKKEEKIKAKRVKTNDETNVALFISLILLSSLGLVGLRKKLNK